MNIRDTLKLMRDQVANIVPRSLTEPNPEKIQAYQDIFDLAKSYGVFSYMTEVVPFLNYKITEQDYEDCLHQAVLNQDLESYISCLKYLDRPASAEELQGFHFYVSLESIDPLIEIIERHVPTWKMSSREIYDFWRAKINAF